MPKLSWSAPWPNSFCALDASGRSNSSLRPEHDASTTQIVGCQFHGHFVARQDTDVVHPHLAGDVTENDMPVLQLHTKRSVGEVLENLALHLNDVVFRHALRCGVG